TVNVWAPGHDNPVQNIPQTPGIAFVYEIPGASSLDWIGGPTPMVGGPYVSWTEESAAAGRPVLVSAVDRDAEKAESTATFCAGVFAGIAGSAFIGAVQELRHDVQAQQGGVERAGSGEGSPGGGGTGVSSHPVARPTRSRLGTQAGRRLDRGRRTD